MAKFPTRTNGSGVTVIAPDGRLNMAVAPHLRQHLNDVVRDGNNRLVVDLAAVESIDSSALGALLSGLKSARQAGGDLRIAAPGPQVLAVLELTNLNRVLKVYDSAESAFDDPA